MNDRIGLARTMSTKTVSAYIEQQRIVSEGKKAPNLNAFLATEKISRATYYRYKANSTKPLEDVIDGRSKNVGAPSSVCIEALAWGLSYIAEYPKAPLTVVHEELSLTCKSKGWKMPSYHALRRAVLRLDEDELMILRESGKMVFEKTALVARHLRTHVNQQFQLDATELDLWVLDIETGELFKPWALGIIDCYSRTIRAFDLVRHSPTAIDVMVMLRRAFIPKNDPAMPFYGIPEEIQTDNAQIFRDGDVQSAMVALGVTWVLIPPRCPSSNGVIEGFFGSFKTRLLKRLSGFAEQHRGLERAKNFAIPFPVLPRIIAQFLMEYHTREHSGIGRTPLQHYHDGLLDATGLVFKETDVIEALRYSKTVAIERDGIELEPLRHYTTPNFEGLVGERCTVYIDPTGPRAGVEAIYNGESLGPLRCVEDDIAVAEEIALRRVDRAGRLRLFRKKLLKAAKHNPPVKSHGVDVSAQMGIRKKTWKAKATKSTGPSRTLGHEDE